jgi:hypothetical protein
MQPEHRLHALTITATLVGMYTLATKVLPNMEWLGTWQGALVAYVSTLGAYKSVHWALALILNSNPLFKRLFLRKLFIHGTWVGYYYGEDGKVRYVVDQIEQEIGEPLRVQGYGFGEDGRTHAKWHSVAADFFNGGKDLIFIFDAEILSAGTKVDGITSLTLSRIHWFSPTWITGSSTNIGSKSRLEVNEEKVSSGMLELTIAYRKAREFYEQTMKATG